MATARDLLARVIAWPGSQDPGYVNVHWWSPHKDHPLPNDPRHRVWWGKPAKTLDEALNWASWAMRQHNIRDIYFCTSVQSSIDRSKAGKPKPLRNKANALNLKCLFIDVDYGKPNKDGKKVSYATLHEALAELTAFCLNKAIPGPTALVSTGGGVHAYWILDKAITPGEWQPYADGLKSAALEYGLLCDAGVTVDCARILRVPDTKNWKSDPVRPVSVLGIRDADYTLDDLKHLLDFAPVTATVTATPMLWGDGTPMVLRPHLPGEIESLAEGLGYEEKLLAPVPILRQCKFFGDALATGGASYGNPLWNFTVLGATFMEQGEVLAHRMSDGHPGYKHANTQALWERKLRERKDSNLGWPSCATIETNGCTACATCPLKGKIKSPLSLGRAVVSLAGNASGGQANLGAQVAGTVAVVAGEEFDLSQFDLPHTYVYNKDGFICRKVNEPDADGKEQEVLVPIFTRRLTGAFCTRHPDTLNMVTTVDKGEYWKASLKREEFATRDGLKKCLLREKIMYTEAGEKHLAGFCMSLMAKLEDEQKSQRARPFGWYFENGVRRGFTYGGKIFVDDGREMIAGYLAKLKDVYMPTGSAAPWHTACKMITDQHAPVLECITALAFAAPLVGLAGEWSTTMCAWGKKGRGKSTALEIGMAVWGHPAKAKEQTMSTVNQIMEKMSLTNSLPIFWDELRDDKSMRNCVDVLWQATEGRNKGRLNSNIEFRDVDTWHNMICVCSNMSLIDAATKFQPNTDAHLMRIFECYVTPAEEDRWHVAAGSPGRMDYYVARNIQSQLEHNYGHMGLAYAAWLGKNHLTAYAEWQKIIFALDATLKPLSDNSKDPAVERYWRAAISTLLAGATFANQLGCDFHVDEMREYLIEQYSRNTKRVKDEDMNVGSKDNTEQKLTAYLKFQRQNTLWTDHVPVSTGGRVPKPKVIRGLPLDRDKGTEVQWFVEDNLLRIGTKAFKKWLIDVEKIAPYQVVQSLLNDFGATSDKKTIGAGTKYACSQESVIDIPVIAHSSLAEVMLQGQDDPSPIEDAA